jgi:two-component system, NtrC family, sensor kinase
LPKIWGDSNQLQQVFLNLITNARDAIESIDKTGDRQISAETFFDSQNNKIVVKVKDSGIGIPKEQLEQIFNPFYTTKSPNKGMGLGLSIVYRIIESHRGIITVSSQEGTGTQFTITFPPIL